MRRSHNDDKIDDIISKNCHEEKCHEKKCNEDCCKIDKIKHKVIINNNIDCCGCDGATGATGSTGAQGVQGPQGIRGAQGAQGSQGSQGALGPQGTQGSQGSQGVQGAQGFQGALGPQGPLGPQGIQGPQGSQGAQGFQGAVGAVGAQGPQGSQGAIGPQGSEGLVAFSYVFDNRSPAQTIAVGSDVLFNTDGPLQAITHAGASITVSLVGVYDIDFGIYTVGGNPQQWAITVNNVIQITFASNDQSIVANTKLTLAVGDIVTIRNVSAGTNPVVLIAGIASAWVQIDKVN